MSDYTISPQPVRYGGHHMRSTLEAKTAKLFDGLGIPWSYETQRWDIPGGGGYLPDFYLPDDRIYVEAKGPDAALQTALPVLRQFVADHPDPTMVGLMIVRDTPLVDVRSRMPLYRLLMRSGNHVVTCAAMLVGTPAGTGQVIAVHVQPQPDHNGEFWLNGVTPGRHAVNAYADARDLRATYVAPTPRAIGRAIAEQPATPSNPEPQPEPERGPDADPLDFPCPACKSAPGTQCVDDRDGYPMFNPHTPRHRYARGQANYDGTTP